VTRFIYDGDRLIAELGASGTTVLRRYVHGAGVDKPVLWWEGSGTADGRSLLADRQGSIVATAPMAGGTSAVSLYTYGPYGERTSWGGPRFAYTGQIALPEASLYHYKARAYDPSRGWFLQTDPVGHEAGDFNLYAYTGGDPVNKSDPSGLVSNICPKNDRACEDALLHGGLFGGGEGSQLQGIATAFNKFNDGIIDKQERAKEWAQGAAEELLGCIKEVDCANSILPLSGTAAGLIRFAGSLIGGKGTGPVDPATPIGRRGDELNVPKGTNGAGSVNGTSFSGHAFDRMQGRGIMPSVVKDAIQNGAKTAGRDGTTIYTNSQVKVIVNSAGKVVTVYPR
jgi:RHS repeat-associated protein